jgi:hypothetical protein
MRASIPAENVRVAGDEVVLAVALNVRSDLFSDGLEGGGR